MPNDELGHATGKVYMFNTTNQKIRVTLNDNPLPKIEPAAGKDSGEGGEGSYRPAHIAVPRSDATSIDDPVFAQTNSISVMFSGYSNRYSKVNINPITSSSNNDLLLYIFYGTMILVDAVTNTVISTLTPDTQ
jgi:hypothetical protein